MEEAPGSYTDVSAVVDTCDAAGISKKCVKWRPREGPEDEGSGLNELGLVGQKRPKKRRRVQFTETDKQNISEEAGEQIHRFITQCTTDFSPPLEVEESEGEEEE
jgi:hypothetical protein